MVMDMRYMKSQQNIDLLHMSWTASGSLLKRMGSQGPLSWVSREIKLGGMYEYGCCSINLSTGMMMMTKKKWGSTYNNIWGPELLTRVLGPNRIMVHSQGV